MKERIRKKTEKKQERTKKLAVCFLLVLAVSVLLGLLGEGLYELNVMRRELKGGNSIGMETISQAEIEVTKSQPSKEDQEEVQPQTVINITLQERYVNKLRYSYTAETDCTPSVVIRTKNLYKQPEDRAVKEILRSNLTESVINVKDYITGIQITVPEGAEIDTGSFAIDNRGDFNWYRVAYLATFAFLIGFILIFREWIAKRIEYGFLVISLCAGILFLVIQPPECIGFDEHIHFQKAFDWFESGVIERDGAQAYLNNHPESIERSAFLAKEEKAQQIEYLNNAALEQADTYERSVSLNTVGYVHMAIAIKAGQLLGLPYYLQFVLGKLANLLLYSALIFFAIRILPTGKKVLAAISLMPGLLLQATAYTYDIVLVGFFALGFSMVIDEFYHLERKLNGKKLLLISVVFVVGSCPKPMYIPLLALLLVMPREKFSSRKIMLLYKGIVAVVCLIMMLTFVLPAAGGSVQGDVRGGATNTGEQMKLVFQHPIAYIRVFLESFMDSVDNFLFGVHGLGHLAYAGDHPFSYLIPVFIFGVALTERKKALELKGRNLFVYKGFLAFLIAMVVGLIWTSLYLVFTPVGSMSIAGVQARYYIPLLLPLFFLFYPGKSEARWKESRYNTVMFLVILFLLHQSFYTQYFLAFCQ